MSDKWSKEELKYLIENYPHESWQNISNYLKNRTRYSIEAKAKKLKLYRTKESKMIELSESHSLLENKSYFKTWSENMAYILGLLYADGSIPTKGNYISIGLEKTDEYILEKIKNEFKFDGKIVKNKNMRQLTVGSVIMKNDLINLGLCINKTSDCTFPNTIPNQYIKDFIRGFMDGDGSIVITKQNNSKDYLSVSFVGTYEMITGLIKSLNEELDLKIRTPYKPKNSEHIYTIKYNGKEAFKLLEYVYYPNMDFFFERKHDKYIKARELK